MAVQVSVLTASGVVRGLNGAREIMKKLTSYLLIYRRLLLQLLLVFLAFTVMVVMSNYFASSIVKKHISNYGDEVIAASAETIKTYMKSHEITLNDMAFVIEKLKERGASSEAIQSELTSWSNWLYERDERFEKLLFLYCVVDDTLILGSDWDYPDDFEPEQRVWYTGACELEGEVFYSDPYSDANTGEYVMTISRQLFKSGGEPFGVIAMDVFVSSIADYIKSMQLMNSGYAVLLDSNRHIIIHPVAEVVGMPIEAVVGGSGYKEIAAILEAGEDISAFSYSDILGASDVAFFKKLFNGWYLELSLSSKVYYRDVDQMRVSLSVTGCILALLVCAVLTFMYEARLRSDEANRTKSSFLAKMSHEIRTPMNAVIGMAELLQHEPLSERQAGYVRDISLSARSLLSIINDILDLSKLESGKLTLEPVNYDFNMMIDNVNSMFRYIAQERGVEYRYENAGDVPEVLFGDETRLRQILTNLIGNAVKFTENGYVRLKVSVADSMLMFEIKDTGIGISKDDMPKLFNAFTQFKTISNRSFAGTGLGLIISKSFVEMMGGRIMIDSEYDQGTIVTVMIPLIPGSRSGICVEDTEARELTIFAPEAQVLIVDDNDFNLKVARDLLTLFGVSAQTASSGREAVDLVCERDYDLVFMDHMMPEMDGIEATDEIRKIGGKFKTLPVIALTANAVHGAKEMFLANGFNDYISKPIDIQELSGILLEWLPPDKVEKHPGANACKVVDAQSAPEYSGEGLPAAAGRAGTASAKAIATAPPGESVVAQGEPASSDQNRLLDIVRSIDVINVEVGLNRVAGMESMFIDNLRSFSGKLIHESDRMSADLENDNIKDFSISVHAMKSALATIGAMDMSETARKLEMASKDGDVSYVTEQFPDFNAKLRGLQRALSALNPDVEHTPDKKPGDAVFLRRQAQIALAASEDFDNELGMEAINSLLLLDFGGQNNAMLQSVSDAFRSYDYDLVKDLLTKLSLLNPSPIGGRE